MIIVAVLGVRGIDYRCTGAWDAQLRRRYYQIMLGLEQMEPGYRPTRRVAEKYHWRATLWRKRWQ
jgi:hypothetical protein